MSYDFNEIRREGERLPPEALHDFFQSAPQHEESPMPPQPSEILSSFPSPENYRDLILHTLIRLDEKMDSTTERLEKKFDDLGEKLNTISTDHSGRIARLETRAESFEKRVDATEKGGENHTIDNWRWIMGGFAILSFLTSVASMIVSYFHH